MEFLKDLLKDFSIKIGEEADSEVIDDFLLKWRHPYKVSMDRAVTVTSDVLQVPEALIFSRKRKREFVQSRQIICWIGKEIKGLGATKISTYFKERGMNYNRATVLHGIKTVNNEMEVNPKYRREINQIKRFVL